MLWNPLGGRPPGARPAPGARPPAPGAGPAVRLTTAVAVSVFLVAGAVTTHVSTGRARGAPSAAAAVLEPEVGPAQVARLLAGVRGASPIACELALRAVDMQGGWFGRYGSAPGAVDTAAQGLVHDVSNGVLNADVVPPLRDALADADPCVRRTAAPLLGRVEGTAGVDALVAALRASAPGTREVAAIGLGFAGRRRTEMAAAAAGASAGPALIAALRDGEAGVRTAAAWALGRLDVHDAVPALMTAMRDPSAWVRESAAAALGEIEDPRAVEPLAAALSGDAEPRVRRAAAWALGQMK
jgi:hypothetical protein